MLAAGGDSVNLPDRRLPDRRSAAADTPPWPADRIDRDPPAGD